jgi:hypothetical protein
MSDEPTFDLNKGIPFGIQGRSPWPGVQGVWNPWPGVQGVWNPPALPLEGSGERTFGEREEARLV